jgi:hypothetical protein
MKASNLGNESATNENLFVCESESESESESEFEKCSMGCEHDSFGSYLNKDPRYTTFKSPKSIQTTK